jgi:hypothetical protein
MKYGGLRNFCLFHDSFYTNLAPHFWDNFLFFVIVIAYILNSNFLNDRFNNLRVIMTKVVLITIA